MANKDTSKQWFETGDFPTQAQFYQLFDWLRWKDEGIGVADIAGLQTILNTLQTTLNNALPNQLISGGNISIAVDDGTTLSVYIPATEYKLKGVSYSQAAGTFNLALRPASGMLRIDVFYLDATGFHVVTGATSATPVKPGVPDDTLELSNILVGFDNALVIDDGITVLETPLHGLTNGDGTNLSATDNILGAFGKVKKFFSDLLTTFNIANKLVKMDPDGKLPAVDGSLLTNLQVANWVQSGANVYYNGGNVGIGTSAPTQKFQIDDSGLGIRTSAFSLINNDTTDPGGGAGNVAHYSPDIYLSAYGWDQTNNIPSRVDAYMRLTTIRHTASNQFGGFKLAYKVDGYTEKPMISVNSSQVFSFGWSNPFNLQTAGISGMTGFSVLNGIMTLKRSTSGQTLDGLTVAGESYGGGSGHSMWSVLQGLSATANDRYRFGMYLNIPATEGSLQEWSVRYSFWKEGARTEIAAFYNDASLTLGGITKYDSALLTLESTTKGFLPPRMTTTQWGMISSKAEGLQAWSNDDHGQLWFDGTDSIGYRYNRSTSKFQGFDGTNWIDLN